MSHLFANAVNEKLNLFTGPEIKENYPFKPVSCIANYIILSLWKTLANIAAMQL